MPAEEPRAIDDVGPALTDEIDEHRELFRRVFEIPILNDHQVAAYLLEAAPQRRALALVPRLERQREAELPLKTLEPLSRPVGRGVVDPDQLDAQRHRQHTPDDLLD